MITFAAIGRYHFFEQALACFEIGKLDTLVCDYPRRRLETTGIPQRHLLPLPWLAGCRVGKPRRWLFEMAGALLGRRAPGEVIKINSGFARESVRRERRVIVDHGSLHERAAARLYRQEADRSEVRWSEFQGNFRLPWLVDRQDEEFAQAESVLVLSQLAKRTLINEGVAAEKIHVSWPGVDAERFHRCPAPTRRPFRLVQVSSLTPAKGLHLTLEAWRKAALKEAELWLIGAGAPPSDLPAGVVWKGAVPQANLPSLLSECDVFVLPSIADGFGLVVLQALACELPVIVSNQCGAAEAVSGRDYAQVIAAGDATALAERIVTFYQWGSDGCRDLGRLARRDVLTRFLWRHNVERWWVISQEESKVAC